MVAGSSPGGQRRATIPRGAQFCSIYLQNHINKCCRIVQLLKSKAAWCGGDARDEISLQRWWRDRRDAAWNLLQMEKWKPALIFNSIPDKNVIFPIAPPIIKSIKTIKIKAFSLHWDSRHLIHMHIGKTVAPSPMSSRLDNNIHDIPPGENNNPILLADATWSSHSLSNKNNTGCLSILSELQQDDTVAWYNKSDVLTSCLQLKQQHLCSHIQDCRSSRCNAYSYTSPWDTKLSELVFSFTSKVVAVALWNLRPS